MQPAQSLPDPDAAQAVLEARDKQLKQIETTIEQAERYQQAKQADASIRRDLRWEAMLPVLERKMPLIVEADHLAQIESAVAFAARHQLRIIIRGGYDAPHCAELLRRHDVPVIVQSVLRLPLRRSDPFDQPYRLPDLLRQANLAYCIAWSSRFDASNMRNLPYQAAMAVAYGLPADEALKSVTLYPARILGVDDRVGTLTVGKDATLVITNGDLLETTTQVEQAMIAGRPVDLSSRHTRLYEKYREKYRQLREEG
jgi:imidazolonepropionase-like amidohydrolase